MNRSYKVFSRIEKIFEALENLGTDFTIFEALENFI
jgi:hypothetical protein